ncbi:hypothetical protein AAFG13_38285 [Bradyrhizobium sp. B124]|uniref:hypothetical protein n=1 Tax=Bradyrhizobium sp. B124 TaxID=3140245 RepID=UPI003183712D
MNHAAVNRYDVSVMTDEQRELAQCRQEIVRLKELVAQLSALVLRNVAENAGSRKPQCR